MILNILRQNIFSYVPYIISYNVIHNNIIHKYLLDHPKILGRWKIETREKTNLKIDLANEDHCGVCNQYIMNKNINTYKTYKK